MSLEPWLGDYDEIGNLHRKSEPTSKNLSVNLEYSRFGGSD